MTVPAEEAPANFVPAAAVIRRGRALFGFTGRKGRVGGGSSRDTEAPDRAFVVELPQQLADRGIEFSQTVEAAVAQAAEQPSLDEQHRDFDFRLVARPARSRWQDRGIIMGDHLGVGPIDLRLVKAGFDDRHLCVVR